jgi:predicted metal-dependent enzyme (double-stranded beta helix superfamily)
MAYGLNGFTSDLNRILKAKGVDGIDEVAEKLRVLLANPEFVAETFNEDTPKGKRLLYHDADSDARVLAHVHMPGKRGKPHSHGTSWAIYGNATASTIMTEWERVNDESEDHAELRPVAKYTLNAGDTKAYGPHKMHSTEHPAKAWVIRITGTDLKNVPRYHFNPDKDKILEDA